MAEINLDHVERLTRGKRSGKNIGSRGVGHHLRPFERAHYQRALKKGYLDITERDRVNLWHVWQKACEALGWEFLVLVKDTKSGTAVIYRNNKAFASMSLPDAKQKIKVLSNGSSSQ